MKVAVLQLALREDQEERLKEVEALIKLLHNREPDIFLLPEAWISPDPLNNLGRAVAESNVAIERLQKLAEEHGAAILGGGLYLAREEKVHVACPIISSNGEVIGFQEKIHLYRRENGIIQRGEAFKTFMVKGVKIGVVICHDLVYPEAVRTLTLADAQIIFNPARIPSHGKEAWHLYLKVRSLENRIPLYAANLWSPPKYSGGSCSVKPIHYGDEIYLPELIEARPGVSAVMDEVDEKALGEARRKRLGGRIPHAYYAPSGGTIIGIGDGY
ncbi:(R)-stereoselective amidase [Candidatus Calditenuaceae archaeon HR02]|nr:(R)-stereoselective amidase [Candidatus Calditenuaceae archaeon HR02]